ncbi:MAG TPA: 3-methyl-2-oxobutanoate hydroxymethyltransferase [Planctomycetaceae bacterium]|nr:3-methyl-2-oxobutanoate hydroxymethyltransferase [Planctomycetaceae bacterium]
MIQSTSPMTVPLFVKAKSEGRKLAVLTAYDFLWAGLFDQAGVDAILVGDSLGMVVQGHATTLPVTLDEMIYHATLVKRAVQQALVIVDMPFLSFQVSPAQAIENAGRILKETGAAAVKLEGGENQARTITALAAVDIPVMAHVGLRPQSVHKLGGMKVQRDERRLLADARAAQEAGAFAIVLELIPRQIAAEITRELTIPTIGIGAGPDCDGQVLVSCDMLGLTDGFHPKFVKHFAELRREATRAVRQYVAEVRSGAFPTDEHSHH